MPAPFRFDRGWRFAVPPADLWATLTAVDHYRSWWPWIVALDLDGPPFTVGSRAHFVIQAPLPYRLRCSATVVDVEPGVLLAARVDGDLEGYAALALAPDDTAGAASAAHLMWELDVETPPLRALARVARPAMVWGHDRIVERGLREFEARALAGPPNAPGGPSSVAPGRPVAPRGAPRDPAPPPPPA